MKRIFYFAYGSNLLGERLISRIGQWKSKQNFVLPNYKLVFNVGLQAFANIESAIGESVEGVLYEITPQQLKYLSWVEGLYETQYFGIPNIPDAIGVVYVGEDRAIWDGEFQRPMLSYLNIIIEGCLENNILTTYNKLIDYKIANFRLKKSKHSKRA